MNVSPDALRKETVKTLIDIELVIKSIEQEAELRGVQSTDFRADRGNWVIAPVLLAKAECLNTLVHLNEQRKR